MKAWPPPGRTRLADLPGALRDPLRPPGGGGLRRRPAAADGGCCGSDGATLTDETEARRHRTPQPVIVGRVPPRGGSRPSPRPQTPIRTRARDASLRVFLGPLRADQRAGALRAAGEPGGAAPQEGTVAVAAGTYPAAPACGGLVLAGTKLAGFLVVHGGVVLPAAGLRGAELLEAFVNPRHDFGNCIAS